MYTRLSHSLILLLAAAASTGCALDATPIDGSSTTTEGGCAPLSQEEGFWRSVEGIESETVAAAVRRCRVALLDVQPDGQGRLMLWDPASERLSTSAPLPELGQFPLTGGSGAVCRRGAVIVFDAELRTVEIGLPERGERCFNLGFDARGRLLVSFYGRTDEGASSPILAMWSDGQWQSLALPPNAHSLAQSFSLLGEEVVLGVDSLPPAFAVLGADGVVRWVAVPDAEGRSSDARAAPSGAVVVELSRGPVAFLRFDPSSGRVDRIVRPGFEGSDLGPARETRAGVLTAFSSAGPSLADPAVPWSSRLLAYRDGAWWSPSGEEALESAPRSRPAQLIGFDGLGRPVALVSGALRVGRALD